MEARVCGTCRHYEPSTLWRRGWCRSSLLFSPTQSHSVQDDELDCSRGSGDFWQPRHESSDLPTKTAGQANVKVPNLSPLKLFAPASRPPAYALAGAGGSMMFARGGDNDGYDYPDQDPDEAEPTSRTRRVTRDTSGRSRSGGDGGGRQRSIQFQPEERYWTDYLRIALPIIGLLLMVGLFWYWVQMLIADDSPSTDQPVSTATSEGQPELASGASTPDPTETDIVNQGQAPVAGATPPPAEETPANEEDEPEETPPPEGADAGAGFAAGDSAVITEEEVNMRSEPSTAGGDETIVAELNTDTVVEIQSGPTEADGFNWWEIVVEETGESGWIAEDFLEPVE